MKTDICKLCSSCFLKIFLPKCHQNWSL